jgi:hypothetical protein
MEHRSYERCVNRAGFRDVLLDLGKRRLGEGEHHCLVDVVFFSAEDTAAQMSATHFYKGLHGGRVDATLQGYLAQVVTQHESPCRGADLRFALGDEISLSATD